jgi:hypothetical protein
MRLAGSWLSKNIGPVVKSVLPGTALTAGFGLLGGGPTAAATYAATDILGSVPATLLGRYAGRNIKNEGLRNMVETGANIAGSLAGAELGGALIQGGQAQQMAQQIEQRSLVNRLPLAEQAGELAYGTQYQLTGLPDPTQFDQLLAQQLSPTERQLLQGAFVPRV